MMTKRHLTTIGAALAVALLLSPAAGAVEVSAYTVGELLGPCIVGDNDSREGAVSEMECEQYIKGFTDAYIQSGAAKDDNVCLPAQNRDDEVRWAFMRWAHEHYSDRNKIKASDGLRDTLKANFMCK